MTLYIESCKESTKQLLEPINQLSKVGGYKINIQQSILFEYRSNEPSGNKIKKTMPFKRASKRINDLGINLTKEVQNTVEGNLKDLNKWENTHVRGSEDLAFFRWQYSESTDVQTPHNPYQPTSLQTTSRF